METSSAVIETASAVVETVGTLIAAAANRTQPLREMCAMSPERARQYGFVSHYNHTGSPATDRLANDISLTRGQLWRLAANPPALNAQLSGWGGAGLDPAALPLLLPALLWALFFVLLRLRTLRHGERLGLLLRVVVPRAGDDDASLSAGQRRKLKKLHGQLWLAASHAVSAFFGYAVQRGKPWFALPVGRENYVGFLSPHPYKVDASLLLYYQYGLGFYISELVYLLIDYDIKRSDFFMFLIHHAVTFFLIVLSHCSYEHRFGVYVLFIHDASDILLTLSKVINYVVEAERKRKQKAESDHNNNNIKKKKITKTADVRSSFLYKVIFNSTTLNICFIVFVASFIFLRIICLPALAFASIVASIKIRMCTVFYWILVLLLHVVIQGLQLYWLALILKLMFNMIIGKPLKDIRSDDDEENDLHRD